MKTVFGPVIAGLAFGAYLLVIQPVAAHHSSAGFNADAVKEISGTIKEFQFLNPHTWIQVMVTDDQGQQEEWSVEWGSPNTLARRGVRPSTLPPGAAVTMRINPLANGAPAGGFIGAKLSDGTIVGDWTE
jgi:hypothetical protein